MENSSQSVPMGHRRFSFGKISIDSNFDSGNCAHAERINSNTFAIWIAPDHPKNNYRAWFHFKVEGVIKGMVVNFQIKNMQNQYQLLQDGLVPVVSNEQNGKWQKISHKINLTNITICDNQMQWSFSHQFSSNYCHTFAFFHPWSNIDNNKFLNYISHKVEESDNIYYHRATIMKSIQGLPIQMITISSKNGIVQTNFQDFDDPLLFQNSAKPKKIQQNKKCIIITARVHPGEVPGSHVMTGILQELTQQSQMAQLLRDQFVFYLFPILNPDGVRRGHFRVDTNGINLNRCYINPSPKTQPSIYAVKKIVLNCYSRGNYFAFLDLHAQASRSGNFIYGNSLKELSKQVQACLFPKILSINSENFQYEGSNFLQKHMYHKDKADHVSKQGCGRVALYYATKNPNSWTLECSYHMGQNVNILDPRKNETDIPIITTVDIIDRQIVKNLKVQESQQINTHYIVQTYRQLGSEVLQSFLDLIEANPVSRISNPANYFKNLTNLKLSLGMALIRMAPNRFESSFRKIYYMIEGTDNEKILIQCYKALYFMIINNARLPNLQQYLKQTDNTVIFPIKESRNSSPIQRKAQSYSRRSPKKPHSQTLLKQQKTKIKKHQNVRNSESLKKKASIGQSRDTTAQSKQIYGNFYQSVIDNSKVLTRPLIKIIQIDKQVYKSYLPKQICKAGLKSECRYESQHKITTYSLYKRRGGKFETKRENNQIFRLQIFPKMMGLHKTITDMRLNLRQHLSMK